MLTEKQLIAQQSKSDMFHQSNNDKNYSQPVATIASATKTDKLETETMEAIEVDLGRSELL